MNTLYVGQHARRARTANALMALAFFVYSGVAAAGQPPVSQKQSGLKPHQIAAATLPAIDAAERLAEDAAKTKPGPLRYPIPFDMALTPVNDGTAATRLVDWMDPGSTGTLMVDGADPAGGGICGDSILNAGETCDDGNMADSDGCSSTCQVEAGFMCTAPMPGATINGVPEGGFEAGTPNPVWAEASTNFGTPLCDAGTCGLGDGTGPNSGAWWTWFGGIAAAESGSVEQAPVFQTTDTELTFAVEQVVCDSGADFARVLIDGNIVFATNGADPACGTLGYRTITIDLATAPGGPYNDGIAHTLRVESSIFAVNSTGSNFFFDDFTLDRGTTPPQPSVCELLPEVCVAEDFDTNGIADWTTFNTGAVAADWGTSNDGVCGSVNWTAGNYAGGSGVAACVDSDAAGIGVVNAYLCSPAYDLSSVSGSRLDFFYNYQVSSATAEDAFEVLVGTTPPGPATMGSYTSEFLTNVDSGVLEGSAATASLDLSLFDGAAAIHVCYRYSGDFDWYAQVDDVAITADACTAGPDTDGDSVPDSTDNCTLVANLDQRDTNGDGFGNICDPDLNNDGIVNPTDLGLFRLAFLSMGAGLDADFNGDDVVNPIDLGILRLFFLEPPGPSGLVP